MRRELRVELLPGGPEYGPDGLPKTLSDARKAGWVPLEKVLPDKSERTLFSVWRTYKAVPPFVRWGQWWDPRAAHTIVLWSPNLRQFLRDAFLLKGYATLKGRQPLIRGNYGIARMFAPLRVALWAHRTWYDYPIDLIKSSIQFVVEIAERSSPARFARGPHHLALAFARPRRGKNITRAQEAAISLMFPDVEDYWPRESNSGIPRTIDMKFLRDLDRKIRNIDQRRKEVISSLRGQWFERARKAVGDADDETLEQARNWAHYILVEMFMHSPEPLRASRGRKRSRKLDKDPWVRMFDQVIASQDDYLDRALSILQNPPTFQEVCRNLGLYIGLRIMACEEIKKG